MVSLTDCDSYNKRTRLQDLFLGWKFVFLFYLGLFSIALHLLPSRHFESNGPWGWCHYTILFSHIWKQCALHQAILKDRTGKCCAQIPQSFGLQWNSEVSLKSFICLLKSAVTAWEFIVVQIALCKSPFNVTFFSFHGTGMSHQQGWLKFHYQGGFGHELKVKAWQHPAKMSPKIIRLTQITKMWKWGTSVKKKNIIFMTLLPADYRDMPNSCFSSLWENMHLLTFGRNLMLHLTRLIIITLHLFSPLSLFQVNFTLLTSLTCYCSLDSLKHSWQYLPSSIYFTFTDNVWYRNSSTPPNRLSSPPVATSCITIGPNMQQRSYQLSVVWLK